MTLAPSEMRVYPGLLPLDKVEALKQDLLGLLWALGQSGDDLDACVAGLARGDRRALAAVYDVVRECQSFHGLIHDEALLSVVRKELNAQRIHTPYQHSVFRMDLPLEGFRGFSWHQDKPYNMLSNTSVTMWTPLTAAGPDNGSIQVAPTQSNRLYPIHVSPKRDPEGNVIGGLSAYIPPRFHGRFEDHAETVQLVPGDVALFGPLLVHRSGLNPGPRIRFSVQCRYGDLLAPEMIERRWQNRRREGFHTFQNLHPDLVEAVEPENSHEPPSR